MPLISVIIPVYNAENYLEDCLKSIQRQTFEDYEVWLINDGSVDSSGKICDTYQKKDTRFHVIHQENGGASEARNAGLHAVQGEWIAFIDADDTIEPTYLQILYNATKDVEKETLIVQGFKTILSRGNNSRREFPEHTFHSNEIYKTFKELNIHRCGFPFAKLYKRAITQQYGITFNKQIHYAEDVMFMLSYLCHATSIKTIEGSNYNYYIRNNNSLSQRIFTFEAEYTCYQMYISLITQLKQRFNLSEEALQKPYGVISEYLIRRSIGSLYQPQTSKPFHERLRLLKSITPEQLAFVHQYYKHSSWFHKVTVFLLTKHYYYLCDLFNISISFRFALKKMIAKYL